MKNEEEYRHFNMDVKIKMHKKLSGRIAKVLFKVSLYILKKCRMAIYWKGFMVWRREDAEGKWIE